MGFKRLNESFTFADLVMKETPEHNRSLKTLEKVDKAINWSRIESILLSQRAQRAQMNFFQIF